MGQQNSRSISLNKRRATSLNFKNFKDSDKYNEKNKYTIKYLNYDEQYVEHSNSGLKEELLDKFSDKFNSDAKNLLALNAISGNDFSKILLNREITINDIHVFSENIELEGKSTNQKSSGRCWLFAATNVMRFLENIIELADEDIDSRLIQYLIQEPVNDGGQWDMVINILEKYGVVPKSAFPESYNSSNSSKLNWLVTTKLRDFAYQLRELHNAGKDRNTLRCIKISMMEEIYRIIAISLGEPPKKFDWTFRDKNGKYHNHPGLTPKSFYQNIIGYQATETLSLINDPRNSYNRLYTVEYLGNIQGGFPIRYVNISIETMKQLSINVLRSGKPVWFAQRLQYGQSLMTHAMVLTGVHLENDLPVRWRVENSWGDAIGDKGYFVMTDDWFSDWVYQIVLEKKDTPKELVEVLDQSPLVLPAWDPMGSLAL
ncbi:1664_t:CDS:2 [Funneliformis geosporum]|uniref:Cysteine proteinase 1, mitochondrial n=1 Tax=Funneliformis geosporum TaxID=1117311 RepID=A0A9W4SI35_9GLOM|nr:18238_t:CDS:2 [Funneliformis geosporum]CAI2172537.1 1664_t:CDS:2 [Funneliformis geosporum]